MYNHICSIFRCLSLPVTMRSILQKATDDLDLAMLEPSPQPVPLTPTLSKVGVERRIAFIESHSQSGSFKDNHYGSHGVLPSTHEIMQETMDGVKPTIVDLSHNIDSMDNTKVDKISNNPLLASLLDQGGPNPDTETPTSMLSALLGDQPQPSAPPQSKQRKPRKRRSVGGEQRSPGSSGKSPKRKASEEDILQRELSVVSNNMDVDIKASPVNNAVDIKASAMPGTRGISPSNSTLSGLLGDDHYIPEPHVIIKETKNLTAPHQSDKKGFNDIDAKRVKEEGGKVEETRRISKASSLAELLDGKEATDTGSSDYNSIPNALATPKIAPLDHGGGGGTNNSNVIGSSKPLPDSKVYDFKLDPDPTFVNKISVSETLERRKGFDGQEPVVRVKIEKNSVDKIESKSSSSDSKSEDRIKEKNIKLERIREKDEDSKPQEREKIKLKMNTKDMTTKILKEPYSSSPQTVGDKLNKDSSKPTKDSKYSKERVYDLTSDSEMPSSGTSSRSILNIDGVKPSSPLIKIKKIRSDESKEKKRSRYRHESESSSSSKRKREENRKDKTKKRRTITDGVYSDGRTASVERYAVERGVGPTTIKITTSGGVKMQIQNPKGSSSSPVKQPSSRHSSSVKSSSSLKSSSEKLSSSFTSSSSKSGRSSSSVRSFNRSRSDGTVNISGKLDSKLIKNPTIKVKPLVMPVGSTSITVSRTSSQSSAISNKTSSSDMSRKQVPKARKSSLSAVIDKLKQQQTSPPIGSVFKRDGPDFKLDRKDTITPPLKKDLKDPVEAEALRKAIIREGNKSSTPIKEISAFKISKSMRPSSLSIEPSKRPEPKTGTPTGPIPKFSSINKSGTPSNSSSSKLGMIGHSAISKSSSSQSSLNENSKTSSSLKDSVLVMRNSSNDSSRTKLSGSSSTGGHGPPDSGGGGTRLEKSESKKESSEPITNSTHASNTVVLSSHSTITSSGNAKEGSKESSDRPRKPKVDDISERLQSRHFLDAVKFGDGNSSNASNSGSGKDPERKPSSKSNPEGSRNKESHEEQPGPSDSTKANGVSSKTPENSRNATDGNNATNAKSELKSGREENSKDTSSSASITHKNNESSCTNMNNMNNSNNVSESSPSSSSVHHNCRINNIQDSGSVRATTPTRSENRHLTSMTNSEDKENSGGRDEDSVFRAPTPKSTRSNHDMEVDRHESRPRTESRSKPVLSPRSDVSSPEDGLVIDCPGTPKPVRSPIARTEKPISNAKSPTTVNSTPDTPNNKSPASAILSKSSPRSPSPRKLVPSSPPAKSPMVQHNSPAAVQHHSPVEIDDDLMDAALMGLSN